MTEPSKPNETPAPAIPPSPEPSLTAAAAAPQAPQDDITLKPGMLPGSRMAKLWAYAKAFAHDDELFIQSTAAKGGGVVAVMVGGFYMIPFALSLPVIYGAAILGAAAITIGVGVTATAAAANGFWNSCKRIHRKINDLPEEAPEKKITIAEAHVGLREKIAKSKIVTAVKGWRISKYIAGTRVWKGTMRSWNRAQMFLSKNSTFINSFAAAGSVANIAAGGLMLTSGTLLFPVLLGGAAFTVTVAAAVGSIAWGAAAGYVLVKSIFNKSQARIENIKQHKKGGLLGRFKKGSKEPTVPADVKSEPSRDTAPLQEKGALRETFETSAAANKDEGATTAPDLKKPSTPPSSPGAKL